MVDERDGRNQIVVIGSGPGGYVAALRAARHGAAVTLVEKDLIGGHLPQPGLHPDQGPACQRRGPFAGSRGRRSMGSRWPVRSARSLPHDGAKGRHRHPAARERRGAAEEGGRGGAPRHRAAGRRPGKVTVEGGRQAAAATTVTVEADKIIIATGSEPARLPMFDFTHPAILTSTEALELQAIPESLLIVGAGAIGCEFASFFPNWAPRSPWWRCCRRCSRWKTCGWPSSSRARTASAASRCCSRRRWRASPSTRTTT